MLNFIFTYQPIMSLAVWCLVAAVLICVAAARFEENHCRSAWFIYVASLPFMGLVLYLLFIVPIGLAVDFVVNLFK